MPVTRGIRVENLNLSMGEQRRVTCILGTRPEAIKLAPVILALKGRPGIECRLCVTGQHREMLDQVMEAFGIVPDEDLNLMRQNQGLAELTAAAVSSLDKFMEREKPDLVLVQGDTTTVFAAALVAFYHHVPVGHVEAGLRTGTMQAPWPEEANRVLTTRMADLHFAPTETNRRNLLKEGIPAEKIFVTGNTVIDALFLSLERIKKKHREVSYLPPGLVEQWGDRSLVLITGHRRENFGEGFESICRAIARLAREFPDVHFVYPVHLNPNVRGPVLRILGGDGKGSERQRNVHLLDPLPYLSFVALMDRSTLILTDSGGVQEEAPSLGKPVLVMRDVTERPEAVESGTVKLVGTDEEVIVGETALLLTDPEAYQKMSRKHNPYGDGKAARRIVDIVCAYLESSRRKT